MYRIKGNPGRAFREERRGYKLQLLPLIVKRLTAIPKIFSKKNTAATDFKNCFQSCSALKAIPEIFSKKNTAATDFSYCFYDCSSTQLTTIPKGFFAKNAEATNFNSCFYGCTYMMFNPNIFVDPTAAEQDKLNRFIDKDMDFRNCFLPSQSA